MVSKWKGQQDQEGARDADDEGDEFVPPHHLSMQTENFMSLAATSMRKDRLKARAAILKATGFVEQNMASPKVGNGLPLLAWHVA